MTLTNCPRCHDVFAKDRFDICPKCRKEENTEIDILKRIIQENAALTPEELADAARVPHERVIDYIRRNRLSSMDAPLLKASCEMCGAKIDTGRFCKSCSSKLVGGFQSTTPRNR